MPPSQFMQGEFEFRTLDLVILVFKCLDAPFTIKKTEDLQEVFWVANTSCLLSPIQTESKKYEMLRIEWKKVKPNRNVRMNHCTNYHSQSGKICIYRF